MEKSMEERNAKEGWMNWMLVGSWLALLVVILFTSMSDELLWDCLLLAWAAGFRFVVYCVRQSFARIYRRRGKGCHT